MVEEKKKINLFTKPTWQDWVMLFVIAMAILMFYFYKMDMANLRTYYETVCVCPKAQVVQNFTGLKLP